MKDGYGKEHYTLAGGEVKLRGNNEHVNEQSSNRLTWPASKANAPEEFQVLVHFYNLKQGWQKICRTDTVCLRHPSAFEFLILLSFKI